MSIEMADENGLNKGTWQKRQRTLASKTSVASGSGDTAGKKKRTATLLDLDAIDCPVCFHTLTIPSFQCENGHTVCSTCCEKLRRKCATCSLPTNSRNRAMEQVLELLSVPCPNAEFGCPESFSYYERLTHLEHCGFGQHACPFSSCDFTGYALGLYEHSITKHCKSSHLFDYGTPLFIRPLSGERVILKERTVDRLEELVVVDCFDTPQGRIIHASCTGAGTEKLIYRLDLFSSFGELCLYESDLKRVLEVSNEPPDRHFMLVPSYMCPGYKLRICIKRKKLPLHH